MPKSRNQLRIERRHAEYERPGTIQYIQAHRQPRPRRWMLSAFKPNALFHVLQAMFRGRKVSVHPVRPNARTQAVSQKEAQR